MYMSPNVPETQCARVAISRCARVAMYQCARVPDETAARARDCETIVVEADFWRHARLSWLAYACIVSILFYINHRPTLVTFGTVRTVKLVQSLSV